MLLDKRSADSPVQNWQSNSAHPLFQSLGGQHLSTDSWRLPPPAGIRTEFTMNGSHDGHCCLARRLIREARKEVQQVGRL